MATLSCDAKRAPETVAHMSHYHRKKYTTFEGGTHSQSIARLLFRAQQDKSATAIACSAALRRWIRFLEIRLPHGPGLECLFFVARPEISKWFERQCNFSASSIIRRGAQGFLEEGRMSTVSADSKAVDLLTQRALSTGAQSRLETAGILVSRYGLVVVLLLIGVLKFTPGEAAGIRPLVAHSPLMSWMYGLLSVQGVSNVIGIDRDSHCCSNCASPDIGESIVCRELVSGLDFPAHRQLPIFNARRRGVEVRFPSTG